MKKIVLTIILAASVVSLPTSCRQDFEEINTSPNSPSKALSYGLFNSANKELMDNTRGSFSSARVALPWVQYSAQRNYTEEDRFQYRVISGDNFWFSFYALAKDYKTIIDLNTDPETKVETSKYGESNNQIAAARIMLAYVFSNLVDRFGDVPYYSYGSKDEDFQALQDNIAPKFASQEKIYTDILKELKESVEMIDTSKPYVFVEGDALFGTPQKMKKFANSLRLRIANRVKGVIPSAATHISEAIASGVMESNADNVGLTYETNSANAAPLWRDFFVNNRRDFSPANTLVETLKGERGVFGVDPRLQKYVAPYRVPNPNYDANDPKSKKYVNLRISEVKNKSYQETDDLDSYQGMPYGLENRMTSSQAGVSSFFSYHVLKADYQEVLMEYSEVCFLISENKGWDDAWYKKGVKASMEKWGVDNAKINTFVNNLPVANKANVLNQKYIALFMQPQEAWNEYRRTGYPDTLLKIGQTHKLNTTYFEKDKTDPKKEIPYNEYTFTTLVEGLTDIPSRLNYTTYSKTLNAANYQAAAKAIGGDKVTTKLIWDKN